MTCTPIGDTLHVGEIGANVQFQVLVIDLDPGSATYLRRIPLQLVGVSTLELILQKPDQAALVVTASVFDSLRAIGRWTTDDAGDLDQAGKWIAMPKVTFASGDLRYGAKFWFHVTSVLPES